MKKEKITIAFASVIEALFLLLEIYFMIHAKGNFPVLLIVAICMVAVLFFLVLSIIELSQKSKEKMRDWITRRSIRRKRHLILHRENTLMS